jgi:hypothetical protein
MPRPARDGVYEHLLEEGLSTASDLSTTAELTAVLIGILGRLDDPGRASAAAALVEDVFDASLRRHPQRGAIACRAGCAHCCISNFVAASIPEVLLQGRWIRAGWPDEGAGIRRRIARAGRTPRDLADAGKRVPKEACPVLDHGGACGAYEARPLACRGYVSTSVEPCLRALADPDTPVPATRTHVFFRGRCAIALFAALKASRLSHASYELGHALAVAVETPDAEARWLAGEDVFAGVQIDPTRRPEVEAFLDGLIVRASG